MITTVPSRKTVVTSTPLVSLGGRLASDFADYLEDHDLDGILLEHQVVDSWMLKNPASDGFFLDLARLSSVVPDTLLWLKQHACQPISGCRVEWCEESVLEELLLDYEGDTWEGFGYALIAASAGEVFTALEQYKCSCLLQMELPNASYQDVPVVPWKWPLYPHK